MLLLENIQYNIGKRNILSNISLKALPGELLAIVGANGAGKSTLLNIMSGALKPSSGTVHFNGVSVDAISSKHLAQQRAVLNQSFGLNLSFTVQDVVMFGRYPFFVQSPSKKDYDIVEQAMKEMDLFHLKDRDYVTLSGGEKQRVHLARVLAQIFEKNKEPKLLLLDEPVSSLDLLHQHTTLGLASKFKSKNIIVVAVLHDLNLTSQYADKILILKEGRTVTFGTTKETLKQEHIQTAYGFPVTITNHPEGNFKIVIPKIYSTQGKKCILQY
jgi:iron complex transport system ATP-binding protein